MERTMTFLKPIYDGRKSFYNKAVVEQTFDGANETQKLYSYNTLVAEILINTDINFKSAFVYGTYSATTLRHIKEFLKQNGFTADSKKQIEKDYLN